MLNQRPDLLYSVGILTPKQSTDRGSELEDLGNLSQEQDGSDDNEGDANVETPPAPWLDPTRKPSSFGLSLSCESNDIPAFEMCITYARYEYSVDENTFIEYRRRES